MLVLNLFHFPSLPNSRLPPIGSARLSFTPTQWHGHMEQQACHLPTDPQSERSANRSLSLSLLMPCLLFQNVSITFLYNFIKCFIERAVTFSHALWSEDKEVQQLGCPQELLRDHERAHLTKGGEKEHLQQEHLLDLLKQEPLREPLRRGQLLDHLQRVHHREHPQQETS